MIEFTEHDGIHEIRLARPPVNALDTALLEALAHAVEDAPRHGAQALLLSGDGQGVFSAGLDLRHLLGLDEAGLRRVWQAFFGAARALACSPLPSAAAIGGHCPAGGCVLALCCDHRVMADAGNDRPAYRIGLNEVRVGLPVPDAVQHLLRRTVGRRAAEKMLVSGAMLETHQALASGLVDAMAPAETTHAQALRWLGDLLALPRQALLATRAIARADLAAALCDPQAADVEAFVRHWFAPETQATLAAVAARPGR